MLTIDQLNKIMTKDQQALFTKDGLAMFLAQLDHESMGFNIVEENLNYRALRLLQVFPKYFNGITAPQFANKPQAIANRVYCNKMGNGDELSGDGYKYRGRGYPQLTGRDNYTDAGTYLGIDLINEPELAIAHGIDIGIWYFKTRKIMNCVDIKLVTKVINGGYNGLTERNTLYQQYLNLLKGK